jgi:hypothetical protein
MFGTIESTHNKIIEKILLIKNALDSLRLIAETYKNIVANRTGKKYLECVRILDNLCINLAYDNLETLEDNYKVSIVSILSEYYANNDNEDKNTREYYRIITSENFIANIDGVIARARSIIKFLHLILDAGVVSKAETKETEYRLDDILKSIEHAANIEIEIALEKRQYEICSKCNTRMIVIPEFSEYHCENPLCRRIKRIEGTVFRDDQIYQQEGQKTKHGGYDTGRHYKFWIDRIQGIETKTFDEEKELAPIGYVIQRDGYAKHERTCETMRAILKDPIVSATYLNDHATLLVKTFGGPSPPLLEFKDNRLCASRFNMTMKLYDIVNPDGGNKPYYPYFIYKILEHMFRNDPEKARILDYIHLQSRETVIKNDKFYEQIAAIAPPDSGIVYCATDPCGRL